MPAKPAKKSPRKPARTQAKKAAAKKPAAKKTAKPRKSRVFTISLPPDLAARAEAFAREESQTISQLFRTALRCYERERNRARKIFDEIADFVKTLPPTRYTEEDIPRLIQEVRAEMRAEEGRKLRKAG